MAFARRSVRSLFGLGTLALLVSGCGDTKTNVDTATVVTDPSVKVGTSAAPAGATTPTTASVAPAADTSKPATPTTPVKAEGWGTLKGKVVFDGDVPERALISVEKDKEYCGKEPIKSEKIVVDGASKGVKNVLVYLVKPTAVNPEAKSAVAAAAVTFDQKGCVFEPHVLPMMVGQKVTIKSSDPVSHNVNSKVDNNVLNQAVAGNTSTPFSPIAAARTPGIVVCDIHPWMTAFWLVLDHPYFAVTNDKGEFEIKNVPAGTQKVVVWQESTRYLTPASGKEVNVAANGTTTEDFKIAPGQVK